MRGMSRVWQFKSFGEMIKRLSRLEDCAPGTLAKMGYNNDIIKINGKIWRGVIRY